MTSVFIVTPYVILKSNKSLNESEIFFLNEI